LLRKPPWKVCITGHSSQNPDEPPRPQRSASLSRARAVCVGRYILSRGVEPKQVCAPSGHGVSRPLASNATEEGRAANRRAEVRVIAYENGTVDAKEMEQLTSSVDGLGNSGKAVANKLQPALFQPSFSGGRCAEVSDGVPPPSVFSY